MTCDIIILCERKSDLYQIFVQGTYDCGSVLLWWRCDTIYTSGFYDVVFAPGLEKTFFLKKVSRF